MRSWWSRRLPGGGARFLSLLVVALCVGALGVTLGAATIAAPAATYVYDAPPVARVGANAVGVRDALWPLVIGEGQVSASRSVEVAGASTTPDLARDATNAVEAGSTVSKINITESGLDHVFDRHLADGALSAGKSTFNNNVTITRLIADADALSVRIGVAVLE